jgi:hypothetical protein
MQKILTSAFALLFTASLFAQHEPIQPFEELGIKVKVLTLSNGKYQESFPNDTLLPIGSVLLNRVTGEIVSIVVKDSIEDEYSLQPEAVSRWLSPDPLAAKYPNWSPYTAFLNNPVLFVDPDGREVIISYKQGEETKSYTYTYQKDRAFEDGTPDFLKNTVSALDHLYSTKATEVTIGEGDAAKTVDVLGQFVGSKDNNITIEEGDENKYSNGTIKFNSENGISFRLDDSKPGGEDNRGRNSPSALLGHELMHGYNDKFDHDNYVERKADKSTKSAENPVSFPNKEEQYVTTNLANQVNGKLGEAKRTNYGRNYYPVVNPTSTKKKE